MLEELLNKFKEHGISIQITLDNGKNPTVHAFDLNRKLHKIEHNSLIVALEEMLDEVIK